MGLFGKKKEEKRAAAVAVIAMQKRWRKLKQQKTKVQR